MRHKSAPVASVDKILFQELQRKARVLDLAVGLGHLAISARGVHEQRDERRHDQQAKRHRNHQFDECETAFATHMHGIRPHRDRSAKRTTVVIARRQRSFTHAVPVSSNAFSPQATLDGGALIGAIPCHATVIKY